ncbi:unnamed protein product, partial [Didymodactylos carnosus]
MCRSLKARRETSGSLQGDRSTRGAALPLRRFRNWKKRPGA